MKEMKQASESGALEPLWLSLGKVQNDEPLALQVFWTMTPTYCSAIDYAV